MHSILWRSIPDRVETVCSTYVAYTSKYTSRTYVSSTIRMYCSAHKLIHTCTLNTSNSRIGEHDNIGCKDDNTKGLVYPLSYIPLSNHYYPSFLLQLRKPYPQKLARPRNIHPQPPRNFQNPFWLPHELSCH